VGVRPAPLVEIDLSRELLATAMGVPSIFRDETEAAAPHTPFHRIPSAADWARIGTIEAIHGDTSTTPMRRRGRKKIRGNFGEGKNFVVGIYFVALLRKNCLIAEG
jgi:hypothetical protein